MLSRIYLYPRSSARRRVASRKRVQRYSFFLNLQTNPIFFFKKNVFFLLFQENRVISNKYRSILLKTDRYFYFCRHHIFLEKNQEKAKKTSNTAASPAQSSHTRQRKTPPSVENLKLIGHDFGQKLL